MNSYGFLAGCYDEFTTDVDYAAWAEYIQRHFERADLPGSTVLDLACGTGSLTRELSLRGYEMIGVDLSPDMLAQAAEKNRDAEGIAPIFCARAWISWTCMAPSTPACAVWTASTMSPTRKAAEGLSAGPPVPHARRAVPL